MVTRKIKIIWPFITVQINVIASEAKQSYRRKIACLPAGRLRPLLSAQSLRNDTLLVFQKHSLDDNNCHNLDTSDGLYILNSKH